MLREVLAFFGVEFDDKALKEGNKTIEASVGKLQALGAAITGSALVVGVHAFIDGVREQALAISELSGQVDISTDELQRWQFTAQALTVSGEDMARSFAELNKRIGDARNGSGELVKRFKDLKVELETTGGRTASTSDVFDQLVASFQAIESPAVRAAHADALFGEAGRKILPILTAETDQIEELREEFEALGGGLDTETIAAFEDMERTTARMDLALTSLKGTIAAGLLPVVEFITEKTTKAVQVFEEMTTDVDKGQLALVALGTAAGFAAVMFGSTLAAALPVAVGIAALIVVVDDLVTAYRGGRSVIADFYREFLDGRELAEDLREVVNVLDEIVTLAKIAARFFGLVAEYAFGLPDTFSKLINEDQLKSDQEALDQLLATQKKIREGAKRNDFATKRDQRFADNPELLEEAIRKQREQIERRKQRIAEATAGTDELERSKAKFLNDSNKSLDDLEQRTGERSAEGREIGAQVRERVANAQRERRRDELGEDLQMSVPLDDEIERQDALRRQQRAEQALELQSSLLDAPDLGISSPTETFDANMSVAPEPLDFTQLEQSTDDLATSNAELSEVSQEVVSSYDDAAMRSEQLATTLAETTGAADGLRRAMSNFRGFGTQNIDNVNVFVNGQTVRDAGEQLADDMVRSMRDAMTSGG